MRRPRPYSRHCGEGDATHAASTIICAHMGINGNGEWEDNDAAHRVANNGAAVRCDILKAQCGVFGAHRGATKPPVRPIKIAPQAAWTQACGLFPFWGDSARYLRGVERGIAALQTTPPPGAARRVATVFEKWNFLIEKSLPVRREPIKD